MTLRPVAAPADAPRFPGKAGPAPRLDWLPVAALVIDEAYQRPLDAAAWGRIQRIARHFRWARFSPVLAADRGEGTYAVIDGQHRVHAAHLCGIEAVPCQVVAADAEEQARAFGWVNGQVSAVTVQQIYKAALAGGEDWALRARAAVEKAGCRLMTYVQAAQFRKAGEIHAIGLVRDLVEEGRDALVTDALSALLRGCKGDEPATWHIRVVKPWVMACKAHDVPGGVYAAFTAEHDVAALVAKARALAERPDFAGRSGQGLATESLSLMLRRYIGRAG